jgi:phosphoribosylanthranilate isomerase
MVLMRYRPRVKICCIMSIEEAALAVRSGADALGLVGRMPSGPGVIPDENIAAIARSVPPGVSTFLLTSEQTAPGVIDHHRRCGTTTIQICDRLVDRGYARIRRELPGIRIVQVIHVQGTASVEEAAELAPEVDALLLDSGNQSLPTKELGGTGRTHDWSTSRTIRERAGVPVFLAGGLKPENVAEALDTVGPYGLDLCSGVRTGGRLDPVKVEAFMSAVRAWTVRSPG